VLAPEDEGRSGDGGGLGRRHGRGQLGQRGPPDPCGHLDAFGDHGVDERGRDGPDQRHGFEHLANQVRIDRVLHRLDRIRERCPPSAQAARGTHEDEPEDPVRMVERETLGDVPAAGVPDHDRPAHSHGVQERGEITAELIEGVAGRRLVRVPVPPLSRQERVDPGRQVRQRQLEEAMRVRVRMQEHDRNPVRVTLLAVRHPHASRQPNPLHRPGHPITTSTHWPPTSIQQERRLSVRLVVRPGDGRPRRSGATGSRLAGSPIDQLSARRQRRIMPLVVRPGPATTPPPAPRRHTSVPVISPPRRSCGDLLTAMRHSEPLIRN